MKHLGKEYVSVSGQKGSSGSVTRWAFVHSMSALQVASQAPPAREPRFNLALAPPNSSETDLERLREPPGAHEPVEGASSYLDALPDFLRAEQAIELLHAPLVRARTWWGKISSHW